MVIDNATYTTSIGRVFSRSFFGVSGKSLVSAASPQHRAIKTDVRVGSFKYLYPVEANCRSVPHC